MKSKINVDKKICIVGDGGFAREVFTLLIDCVKDKNINLKEWIRFMLADKGYQKTSIMGIETICHAEFDPALHQVIIGIGDSKIRERIVNELPVNTEYATLIHPNAIISDWVEIAEGSVVCAGSIITCNIKIGKHSQLNLMTTVGHDCQIDDYFTTAPATNISGICTFGKHVYFGTNSSVKQGISICDNVTIGMGAIVVKNINESGVYIGSPAKKMISA